MQQDELRAFLRLAADNSFLRWLDAREASLQKNLVMQSETVQIYRTQGELRFAEALRKGIEHARSSQNA